MTPKRLELFALAMCLLAATVVWRAERARADGVPATAALTYGGVLDDGTGRPVEGSRSVTVRLWDAAAGGAAVCTTVSPTTPVVAGRFRVTLDDACATAVRNNPNLWTEVIVDATTFPRTKVTAVPYALEAGRAAAASGALAARLTAVETQAAAASTAASRSRQVEIGELGPRTTSCSGSSYQIATCATPLTVTASSSGLYRVSTFIQLYPGSSGADQFRIAATPSVTFLGVPTPPINFMGSPFTGPVTAYANLEAGRTYTFRLEYLSYISEPSGGPCSLNLIATSPLVVEQMN